MLLYRFKFPTIIFNFHILTIVYSQKIQHQITFILIPKPVTIPNSTVQLVSLNINLLFSKIFTSPFSFLISFIALCFFFSLSFSLSLSLILSLILSKRQKRKYFKLFYNFFIKWIIVQFLKFPSFIEHGIHNTCHKWPKLIIIHFILQIIFHLFHVNHIRLTSNHLK